MATITAAAYGLFGATALPGPAAAQGYPPREVEVVRMAPDAAAQLGWTMAGLDAVVDAVARLSTDDFIISTGNKTVLAIGRLDQPHHIHSARKAILSAVIGQHVGDGPRQIPLDATLENLGIDDSPNPLTPLQKQATVLHLLRSKSGVNHAAAASDGLTADTDRRLGHAPNQPGTIWAYNNWDYNVLTTIFEQRTGLTVAASFKTGIAEPIGMQDYTDAASSYSADPTVSQHRAAMFRLSGRDFAKFAQLFLNKGKWGDRQLIPASWIERIAADQVDTGIGGLRSGHGFLWWLPSPRETGLPAGTFFAWGLGNQAAFVIPQWDTVIVHQSDTAEVLQRWIAAMRQGTGGDTALGQIVEDCLRKEAMSSNFCIEHRFIGTREFDRLIARIVSARRQ